MNNSIIPALSYLTDSRLGTIEIAENEIKYIIMSLNPYKTHNKSIQMLQLCAESIHIPLGIIFRNIVKTDIFSDQWKLTNVTPIHKKNNKQLVSNYRPISLLPICSKIFEKIVFNNIYRYLVANDLISNIYRYLVANDLISNIYRYLVANDPISKHHTGCRPGDSTTSQLLYLVHTIRSALDEQKQARTIFLDMSKAFNKFWHDGLLFKGFESEWDLIKAGVPQGSVLGPLLFLIYINNLENGIISNVKLFPDDTYLFSIVTNPPYLLLN